jgi:hypothetical protein
MCRSAIVIFASNQTFKFKPFDGAVSVLVLEAFALIGDVSGYSKRIRGGRNDRKVVERECVTTSGRHPRKTSGRFSMKSMCCPLLGADWRGSGSQARGLGATTLAKGTWKGV